ncbi:MAG: transglutaminase family protein [Dehalococcoidia bacterium]|jgi:transglutaminase-like putative cysteine protease
MRWRIEHALSYRYSKPVALGEQIIRLRPRLDSRQQVLKFELNIRPTPSFSTHYSDIENNMLTTVWFQGAHPEMEIAARSEVELSDREPYDFILTEPAMTQLPLTYPETLVPMLSVYTTLDREPTLNEFLKPVLLEAKNETIPFLNGLAVSIFKKFKRRERKNDNPWAPEKTLEKGQGACRDLAWLYIIACRSLGLAARFVSGYHVPFNPRKKPELHAWTEVFLPGAGWIGFDPGFGTAVSERYIAIAASYDPALTLPTDGKFWGTGVKSVLKTAITIAPV